MFYLKGVIGRMGYANQQKSQNVEKIQQGWFEDIQKQKSSQSSTKKERVISLIFKWTKYWSKKLRNAKNCGKWGSLTEAKFYWDCLE